MTTTAPSVSVFDVPLPLVTVAVTVTTVTENVNGFEVTTATCYGAGSTAVVAERVARSSSPITSRTTCGSLAALIAFLGSAGR